MANWRALSAQPETPILRVLETLDRGSQGSIVVIDHSDHLLGFVTDGDIRRALLRQVDLQAPISEVMNVNVITAPMNTPVPHLVSLMEQHEVSHIPLVDDDNHLVDLACLNELTRPNHHENWVVIMAGGLGSRLQPLTNEVPKPMIEIGGKPILEIILDSFIDEGLRHFYISVNYKGESIEDHFGDGSQKGCHIDYLHEPNRLGTAGALSLLPHQIKHPIIVMNGDIMTRVNFKQLLNFHQREGAKMTVCVRKHTHTIPYGVVDVENSRLVSLKEKPTQNYFINTGIYVINPELIDLIPRNTYFDMPQLVEKLLAEQSAVATFPIHEYWLDIGQIEQLHQAELDYANYISIKDSL